MELVSILLAIAFIFLFFFTVLKPESKQYGIKSITEKGEYVKSRGEKQIADYFENNGIKYDYEPNMRGIYGVYDLISKLEAENMSEIKEIIITKIRRIPNIRSSLTLIALE